MKKIAAGIEYLGLLVVALSVLFSLLDLNGAFIDSDKVEVLEWATTSGAGLAIEHAGARKLLLDFPLPDSAPEKRVTHLTKNVINSALGGSPIMVSINCMYEDTSRSPIIVNLRQLKEWVYRTSYPWVSWWLSFVGLTLLIGGKVVNSLIRK